MKICITGAASTVARKLIEILEKNHELTLLDVGYPENFPSKSRKLAGSVLDRKLIGDAFQGQDAVIHMAIANGGVKRTDGEIWNVNVEGTLIVLQEAVAVGVKRFIFASSLSVFDGYGNLAKPLGITEETEPRQKSLYGLTKYLGEIMTRFYAAASSMKTVVLRLIAVVPEPPLTSWASPGGFENLNGCRRRGASV